MSVVFNEVAIVENAIATGKYPEKTGIKRFITMLISYYYLYTDLQQTVKTYTENVLNVMKSFNLDLLFYQEYKFFDFVKTQSKNILDGKKIAVLKNVKEINVTEDEIKIIKSAKNENEQKVLFTLYALSKIQNNITGWVNYSDKDIFELANVNITNKNKMDLIHDLYTEGLIQINHVIEKDGYKVELGEDADNIAMTITDFRDFGKQYLDKYKDGWKMCKCCHKMFKIKSKMDYSSKYCKKCAEEVNRNKTRERMKILRENENFV